MTKISTYVVDEKVTALDKWIGSDANMQNRTKNFTPKKLAAYFNEDQVINIGTPLQYKYYTLDPLEARPNGTLTFETEIGPTVNFSSITTFLLSKYTTKQNIVSDFLNFLDGSKVLLFKSSDINSFGFYRISSLEPYEPDPNFFVVTVAYETGNGSLEEDEDYMISLVSLAGDFIPTKTSELINDGDDGVNPFISELDIDRTEWDAAYEGKINSAEVTGDTTKTLTLTKQDGSTIEASWTDSDTGLTSVGVSMPTAFSVENSPLTSNGTINITGAGTSLEYIKGDGTLGIFPTLTGYIPYVGATQDVDLGTHQLKADSLAVSTASTETVDAGEIVWNAIDGTFDMGLIGGVTLQAGQELHMYGKATEAISNGQAVMFAGVQGDHILIAKADAATINANPEYLIGIATQDFVNNQFGYVTVFGNVRGLDTTGYTLGSVLYYNSESSTDGLLTATMPTAPNAKIIVAAVVRVHATQGILLVRPHVMPKLKDIQDVYAPSPSDKNGLFWNNTNSRYENNSIAGILGYTPANDSNVVKLTGVQTIEGIKTFSESTKFDYGVYLKQDGITASFPGYTTIDGTTNGYVVTNGDGRTAFFNLANVTSLGYTYPSTSGTFALTSDLHSPVTIGTANGLSLSGQQLSLGLASSTLNGALSSTDWNAFNNKQAAGNYITSLTGEVTASGPGAASATLNNASVTGKILSGVNITGGTILDTDTMLTAFGKLQNQINSLIGGSIYQGVWNANTNTPTLTSSVGVDGNYYIVNVAGSTDLNGITDWKVGDWAIFHGGTWQKVDNTDAVSSVNGFTGAVSLTTDNIAEGVTNQYFLNSRARAALSFAVGSGAYNSTTGVITIPTNNNQITNGSNFITLASLSGSAPIQYNNTTGAISITQAGASSNGFLSSTDWNTFNNKQNALTNPVTGTGGNTEVAFFNSTGSTITSHPSIKIVGGQLQTASLKVLTFGAGMVYSDSVGNVGTLTGTVNELTYWSSTGTIGSLSTGAYPSLTEISYVKGVTSSIQTQLNGKQNTITNPITGTGTTNYIPKFTGASSLGNSLIYDNGTNVGIGTTSPYAKFSVNNGTNINLGIKVGQTDTSAVMLNAYNDAVTANIPLEFRASKFNFENGNVGIGTTEPSQKLTIGDGTGTGNQYLRVNSSASDIYIGQSGSGLFGLAANSGQNIAGDNQNFPMAIGTLGGQPLILGTSNAERMRITSSGNVGIGTTSPSQKLDVFGTSRISATTPTQEFYSNANGDVWGSIKAQASGTGSGASLVFSTKRDGNSASDKMIITQGGNVGIGTTAPANRLDVKGADGTTTQAIFASNSTITNGWGGIQLGNAAGNQNSQIIHNSAGDNSLNFISNYSGGTTNAFTFSPGGTERVRFLQNGNVGIGTTAPSAKLHINQSSFNIFRISRDSLSDYSFELGGAGEFYIKNNLNSIYPITVVNNGNVGIGTTSPVYKLSVLSSNNVSWLEDTSGASGAVFALFSAPGNTGIGSIARVGTTSAIAYNSTSDYRLKEDLKEVNGLDKISKIKIYDFKWKNHTDRMDGVMAHELQEVVPYAVTGEKDGEQMQSVDYSKLVPLLIASIQELKAEIEILKNK